MTDKELLEYAAKAAGIEVRWHEQWKCFVHVSPFNTDNPPTLAGQRLVWVPLTDDGDALRLVVELMLTITMRHHESEVFDEDGMFLASESLHCPPDARRHLVRRAIVRAAAVLGSGHNAAADPR